MNRFTIAGSMFIAISIICSILSIVRGETEFYLVIIIPVLVFKGLLGITSISTFILGIIFLFLGIGNAGKEDKDKANVSNGDIEGIVFIGPIPIVFGKKGSRSRYPSWKYLLLIGIALFIFLNLMVFLLAVVL